MGCYIHIIKERRQPQMKNKDKQELILKVGSAGGSLSVWAVNAKDGARSFLVKRDESTTEYR